MLNVRQAPNASTASTGVLRRDEVIQVLADSDDGRWVLFLRDGSPGWASKRYLLRLPNLPEGDADFPWMPIAVAEKGVAGLAGRANNRRVLEYLQSTDNLNALAISRDETSWCSAFVNWCMTQAGFPATRSALARSWLQWGRPVKRPRRGCLVVFSRAGGFGHVGFYVSETETDILVLGGNQRNPETGKYEVSESYYPKSRLLGYRVPW